MSRNHLVVRSNPGFGPGFEVYNTSRMYQVSARINGRDFTGRGKGPGMFVGLRETAASKCKRSADAG